MYKQSQKQEQGFLHSLYFFWWWWGGRDPRILSHAYGQLEWKGAQELGYGPEPQASEGMKSLAVVSGGLELREGSEQSLCSVHLNENFAIDHN
jgi:hypothetical protein